MGQADRARSRADDAPFTVRAARSGVEVMVGATQSIAAALIAAGVRLPLSCEQGLCGTCLTRVLAGIPDHRDVYLTDAEKTANTMIVACCSRSRSPLLVLDA